MKESSSSDPPGAPTVEAGLGQDAALVPKRESAFSAVHLPTVQQPVVEPSTPADRTTVAVARELEHKDFLAVFSDPYSA